MSTIRDRQRAVFELLSSHRDDLTAEEHRQVLDTTREIIRDSLFALTDHLVDERDYMTTLLDALEQIAVQRHEAAS